ncbi:type II secretion system protein [Moritella sp. 24]|uniref:type II secretion system protein n=1 Tax=Moritella sp. 24 TaxID=2746230 RepID=UPI001BA70F50|nr:type II secretion system protein [Moritella sp. 24]QUM76142.1 type II secretion system protein [Moritella sp. 24]
MKIKSSGFTLIELVIVIIVLGVLAATALPKFLDIGQDAHDATAKSSFAAFDSAVKLYHSCWLTSGESGVSKNLACFGEGNVDSTKTGYPLAVSPVNDSGAQLQGSYCEEIWGALLNNNDFKLESHNNSGGYTSDTSVVYWYAGRFTDLPNTYCYYNYIADDRTKGAVNWQLRYYPGDGRTEVHRSALSY